MGTKKKKRVKPAYWATMIPLSDQLKGNSFNLMKEVTSKVGLQIAEARETWLYALLNNKGIKVDRSMSKRELQEVLSKHKVVIKKLEKHNLDRVFIDDKEVGTWDNNVKYEFNNAGKFVATIFHTSPTKNLP